MQSVVLEAKVSNIIKHYFIIIKNKMKAIFGCSVSIYICENLTITLVRGENKKQINQRILHWQRKS